MIAITNLVKRFSRAGQPPLIAVNQVSLSVGAGEVYGLLGPNGAGKTTTLRMLSTLMRPDSGTLLIHGVDGIANPQEARTHLAYVPAEAGLPDKLSPVEVVTLYGALQGVSNPRQRAHDNLARLGAAPYENQPCGDLSTGMKRRVVLARALVHNPSVLLLDEPTDGLDVSGRRDVLKLVREIAETGRAIIISSHIMSEVEKVADRVGVVSAGVLVAEGTIPEILAHSKQSSLDDAFIALTSLQK